MVTTNYKMRIAVRMKIARRPNLAPLSQRKTLQLVNSTAWHSTGVNKRRPAPHPAAHLMIKDNAAELLAGFDGDDVDNQEPAPFSIVEPLQIPKKAKTELNKLAAKKDDVPGALYLGRIPHGFYEHQIRAYFSQFGDIKNLRLSRNKLSGASKHYAFVEFESEDVAKIAAEAMDNYLMFGHILKAKFAPSDTLHPEIWKGANKRFRKIPHERLEREKLEAPKTIEKWETKIKKEQEKREKNNQKLREKLGYDIELPRMTKPGEILEQNEVQQEVPSKLELIANAAAVPDDREGDTITAMSRESKKDRRAKLQHPHTAEAHTMPVPENETTKTIEERTPRRQAKPMHPDVLAQMSSPHLQASRQRLLGPPLRLKTWSRRAQEWRRNVQRKRRN